MKKISFLFITLVYSYSFAFDNTTQPSISTILNPDGSVKTGTNGSYNVQGFKMKCTESGAPRFIPEGTDVSTSWQPGLNPRGLNNAVYVLAVDGSGNLYAGGQFTTAGTVAANYIAKWNGTTWSALGTGMNGGTNALAFIGTDLYAGGVFTSAGGVSANRIAKWNGTTWSALGTGMNSNVYALAAIGTDLYAGGQFTTAGGVTVNRIAKWNGTTWSALGAGVNNIVNALTVIGTEMYVGGAFTIADGTVPSSRIAQWHDDALPVEITYFNSSLIGNNVSLTWGTAWELNNSGFDIERQKAEGNWQKAGFVPGNGTTNEPKDYVYEDKKLSTGTYKYRLKQIDYNGNYEYFALDNDIAIGPPGKFSVSQNYPNPSNPKSRIDFQLPFDGKVTLKVYDLLGREVITLINEIRKADFYTVEFDGSNLASGVYYYKLTAGDFTETKKMVLIK